MKRIKLKNGEYYDFNHLNIMGIINVTPDSFYEGSRTKIEDAAFIALKMVENGAEIIDIGGESSRPGCDPVTAEEEINRIIPVIKEIRKKSDILISIDTYHSTTAEAAIIAGADIINDISGLKADEQMVSVCAKHKVPIVIMHMIGNPKNMQSMASYENVTEEVIDFFEKQIEFALKNGIDRENIILDPGIGFSKNYDHNVELIRNLDRFVELDYPILLAVSRKRFIGAALNHPDAEDRLYGTIGISCLAATKKIDIIRVHDVKENTDAIRMMEIMI